MCVCVGGCVFLVWGVSLTHPVLAVFVVVVFPFISGEFLLHIPYWLHIYEGSFSYTSRAGFIFLWGVSLTHPNLLDFSVGSFSYTSHAFFAFCFCLFVCLF